MSSGTQPVKVGSPLTAEAVAATGVTCFGVVGREGVVVIGRFGVVGCDGAVVVGGDVVVVTGHTVEIGVGEVVPPAATVTLTVVAPGDATTVRCWLSGAEVTTPPVTST